MPCVAPEVRAAPNIAFGGVWGKKRGMPRILLRFWVVGVVLVSPIVFVADRFLAREYGPLGGYVIGFMGWVFLAAVSYIVLRLIAEFMRDGKGQ